MAAGPPLAVRTNQQDRRLQGDRGRPRATLGARHARCLRLPRHGAARCQGNRRRLPVPVSDRRQPGPDRDDAGHVEHPVDRQLGVPGRLLHARHSGAGVGDRAGRLACRHGASPERPDGDAGRLPADQLSDPHRFASDRRRSLSRFPAQPRCHARCDRRQRGGARRQAGSDRGPPEAGAAGGQSLRRAAL